VSARERVEAAIEAAQAESSGRPMSERMFALVQAGLQALADEIDAGAGPVVDLVPVPEPLPTENGAVIVVTELRGVPCTPRPAVYLWDGADDVVPWRVGEPGATGYAWCAESEITGWAPARIVRDDEDGPVATLEHILALVDSQESAIEIRGRIRTRVRDALAAVKGDPT
jgi:hypothetical protein